MQRFDAVAEGLPAPVVALTFERAEDAEAFRAWLAEDGWSVFAAWLARQSVPPAVLAFEEFAAPPRDARRPVPRCGPLGVYRPPGA